MLLISCKISDPAVVTNGKGISRKRILCQAKIWSKLQSEWDFIPRWVS